MKTNIDTEVLQVTRNSVHTLTTIDSV